MNEESPKKIVITSQDVNSRQVDEVLAQQMSFGMPAAAPVKDRKPAWYYSSWFILMVAGTIGAFIAWAVIEPYFGDGVTYTGEIKDVREGSSISIPKFKVLGEIDVDSQGVLILDRLTRISGESGPAPAEMTALRKGETVEVFGEAIPVQWQGVIGSKATTRVIVAHRIKSVPKDMPHTTEDLESMQTKHTVAGLLLFPVVAAFVGFFVGAADGLISRAWGRAVIGALVGLGVSFGAGLVLLIPTGMIYSTLSQLARNANSSNDPLKISTFAFLLQMSGRGAAWAVIGISMGMGPGIVLRSKKLFFNGLIGGVVGGLLGGMLFDPINYIGGGGSFGESAASSRALGLSLIGCAAGLMIGLVELIAREAWLKMLAGPLAGKEFVIYKNPTSIGSSPKREVYLFKDPEVEPVHAMIHKAGEGYEIEDQKTPSGTQVNGRKVSRQRLKNQDQIRIGTTVLLFTMKED